MGNGFSAISHCLFPDDVQLTVAQQDASLIGEEIMRDNDEQALAIIGMQQADVNYQYKGVPLLSLATKRNSIAVMQALVNSGALLDTQTKGDGYSALMYASANGHYDAVKLLVDLGAKVSLRNHFGNNALEVLQNMRSRMEEANPRQLQAQRRDNSGRLWRLDALYNHCAAKLQDPLFERPGRGRAKAMDCGTAEKAGVSRDGDGDGDDGAAESDGDAGGAASPAAKRHSVTGSASSVMRDLQKTPYVSRAAPVSMSGIAFDEQRESPPRLRQVSSAKRKPAVKPPKRSSAAAAQPANTAHGPEVELSMVDIAPRGSGQSRVLVLDS